MRTILSMMQSVEAMDIDNEIFESIDSNTEKYEDLQRQQLFAGITSDGKDITPFYHPFTEIEKRRKGQPFDRVTLKDTGDFYSQIFATIFDKDIEIGSDDDKTDALKDKYGEEIFGLADTGKQEFIDTVGLSLTYKLKQKINGSR